MYKNLYIIMIILITFQITGSEHSLASSDNSFLLDYQDTTENSANIEIMKTAAKRLILGSIIVTGIISFAFFKTQGMDVLAFASIGTSGALFSIASNGPDIYTTYKREYCEQ